MNVTRRSWLRSMASAAAAAALRPAGATAKEASFDGRQIADQTLDFIRRCAREDGSYAPSPDKDYKGNSDTGLSDLAAVTYATVLAKTMAWELPRAERSIEFLQRHQQADGSFANQAGGLDPNSDGAVLYNTVQGVVGLRALAAKPSRERRPCPGRLGRSAFRRGDGQPGGPFSRALGVSRL